MKNIKKILSAVVITTVLSIPVSSLAATIYVGNVGFDTNKIAENDSYGSTFRTFLAQNIGKGVKVDFNDDGKAVNTDDFANSGLTNIAAYDTTDGVLVPSDYGIWSGIGTPEAPIETDFEVKDIY